MAVDYKKHIDTILCKKIDKIAFLFISVLSVNQQFRRKKMILNKLAPVQKSELVSKRELGNRVLMLRNEASLSQTQLAESMGLSARSYRSIETGDVDIKLASLVALQKIFNVELEWLATGRGPKIRGGRIELVQTAANAVFEAMKINPRKVATEKLAVLIAHTHEQAWAGDENPSRIAENLAQLVSN